MFGYNNIDLGKHFRDINNHLQQVFVPCLPRYYTNKIQMQQLIIRQDLAGFWAFKLERVL